MKEIVFFRHGHAMSLAEAGVDEDSQRPLSERGIDEAGQAARQLVRSGVKPELLLVSTYMRARQTAEILSGLFPEAEKKFCAALAEQNPSAILGFLASSEISEKNSIVVVGHQPSVGFLSGYFTGRIAYPMTPASFVSIEVRGETFSPSPDNILKFRYDPDRGILH